MANISPGVYTKIIDLSTYVQAVPSTIGMIAALTKKGEDNNLKFVGSRADLVAEFGEPNITAYGKNFGQGLYNAYNFLGESGSLYFVRALPDDATYSNMQINVNQALTDATASIAIVYVDSVNTHAEIQTSLITSGTTYPLCMLRPIGRGEYYNGLGVRFTEHSNPLLNGVYVMDVYERQSDGDDVIIESFEVSFDPRAVDGAGDSLFISYVLEAYSAALRADMQLASGEYAEGFDVVARVYDKGVGTVTVVETATAATITDNKQEFSDWETNPETGNASFVIIAKDAKGNTLQGWLGASSGSDGDTVNVFDGRDLDSASQSWVGDVTAFDPNSEITYEVKRSNTSVATAFTSSEPVPLKKGSDGALIDAAGDVVAAEAETLLENAYAGNLTSPITGNAEDSILDTEDIYFSVVFDAGYPADVKSQISTLVQTRRDCVAIIDNGDNASANDSLEAREDINVFNNYFVAMYEEFNKVSDIFTGQDVWFSPVYHMSYLLPRNDRVAELWYAAAGFNRAAIDTIKELRFNPRLGQRDQMYLKQLNPIVKFNEGYVVWGQLTSQAKASALQDLNIVRLVLYCKRAFEQYCRFFIFEQNDQITWNQVSGDIVEFLEAIRKKRGLYDYKVEVGATDYEKKRKTFHVDVTLQPTRVVEKIELNFFIK